MTHWVRQLPHKDEDLSLNPLHPHEGPASQPTSVTPVQGMGHETLWSSLVIQPHRMGSVNLSPELGWRAVKYDTKD